MGLNDSLYGFLVSGSLGLEQSAVPLPRFIPVRLYVSHEDIKVATRIREAVQVLVESAGFAGQELLTSERGSWWYRWIAKSGEVLRQPEVMDRLEKLERAVELNLLHRPQAEADEKQANAAAKLIEALRATPNAVCQIGSVLVVKTTDPVHGERIATKTLTQKQMIAIEQNDLILRDPRAILKVLSDITEGENRAIEGQIK